MSTLLPFLLVFIIALAIGVFIGKLLFSARFQSEKISLDYLSNFNNFKNNIRKHDISDALLMIIFHYKTELDKIINKTEFKSVITIFEEFKFKKLQI